MWLISNASSILMSKFWSKQIDSDNAKVVFTIVKQLFECNKIKGLLRGYQFQTQVTAIKKAKTMDAKETPIFLESEDNGRIEGVL